MTADAEHTLVVGVTGGGKSTLVHALLKGSKRCIAVTTKRTDYDGRGWVQCYSVPEVVKAMRSRWDRNFKICLRIFARPNEHRVPIEMLHRLSLVLYEAQMPYARRQEKRQITLVADEMQRTFPHNRPKGLDAFAWVISEGRDHGINLVAATQRPTNIPPVFRDNVTNLYCLTLGGSTAVDNIKAVVGARELRSVDKYRYALYRDRKFVKEGSTKTPHIVRQTP